MKSGDVIAGRFELEGIIGSGGMGEIHRAIDRTSGERVALKSLRAQGGDADRFLRESQILAELSHPAIVRYVAHGESRDGELYLAMEWLEGEDLASRLARAPLTVAESLALITRVAEALALVHAQGVLHRDLKPSNLFLRQGLVDNVMVLDFGIARISGGVLTVTGNALGTPGYMSPEQARGERNVDARADVFALGCVLFECLAGRPAFMGEHAVAILGKILFEEAPRLRDVRPEVSPALDVLVARMLSKATNERPFDAGALLLEILTLGAQSGAAPLASVPPPAMLTEGEQRLLSVVVAREAPSDYANEDTIAAGASEEPLDHVRMIANRYGARIDRVGDGTLMAVVAIRGSATDQAANAARLSLDLHADMPRAQVVAATGRGVVSDRFPVGDAIDRATALIRTVEGAPPGQITIDSTTAALIEAKFDIERLGDRIVLLRERATDSARLLLGKPMPCVGRDRELSMLETIIAESRQDSVARAVLVTAPSGLGKSRLLSELLRRIESRDDAPQIWIGRADATRAGSPFGLLGPLLRAAAGVREGQALGEQQDRIVARVARHVDASARGRVSEFIGEMSGVSFGEEAGSPLQAARRDPLLMSDQMARAFEELVDCELRAGPLLIALEDIHWGDLPSLTFLDRVLRSSKRKPLTVLAMARPDVRETFPKLWGERDLTEIRLAGLSPRAAERLVRGALGEGIGATRIAAIVERADGNAFYLEELIRAESEGRHDDLPETVLAMVQMRLESLPDEVRRVLRAASVLGETFWEGGLAVLFGARTGNISNCLRSLVDREIVQPSEPSRFPAHREYRFRHAIVREAAYGLLTESDRALGHRLAARWLADNGETDALALAEHHRRGGATELAIACYVRAADQALEANDFAGAISRADDGIGCGASSHALGELRRVQADAHRWSGRVIEAASCGMEAMELLLPGSVGWCKAADSCALAPMAESLTDDQSPTNRLIDRMLAVEPREGAAVFLCGALCMLARSMFLLSRAEAGNRLFSRLEPLVESLNGKEHMVNAQFANLRAVRARMEGDTSRSVQLNEVAIAECEAVGATRQVLFLQNNLADCLLQLGAYARAIEVTRAVVPIAEKMMLDGVTGLANLNLSFALGEVGQTDEAIACGDEAMRLYEQHANWRYSAETHVYRANILASGGRADLAEEHARKAVELSATFPPIHPHALAILAHIELCLDRVDEALLCSREALDLLDSLGSAVEGAALARLTHASALHRTGAVAEAKIAIADARDHIRKSAALIGDPGLRQSFLEQVRANAETLRLADAWLA